MLFAIADISLWRKHKCQSIWVHSTTGCSDGSCAIHWLHSYWLSLPKVALHFCIKLNISQLCRIAGNTYILLPNITVPCVAGNWQLSIAMNGIVSLCRSVSLVVWTGLQTQSCYWINMWLTNWTEEFHLSTFYNTLQCIGTCCATKKENINTLSLSMYVNT